MAKQRTRLFAGLLTICMLFTSYIVIAEDNSETKYDLAYVQKYELLKTLIGLSTEIPAPDTTLTRMDISNLLASLIGIETVESDISSSYYSDIENSKQAYIVNALKAMGVISGNSNGYFYPNNNTTVQQAIKMLVCMVGYSTQAESSGGFPTGYLSTANTIGLLSGVELAFEEDLKWSEFVSLLLNALDINIMKQTSYGADNNKYSVVKNDTLLSVYHDIYKVKGIVDATYISALNKESHVRKGYISIDNVEYNAESVKTEYLLGHSVIAYYISNENNEKGNLIFITSDDKKNNLLNINMEDVKRSITSKFSIVYNDANGRFVTADVKPDCDILYNGEAIHNYKVEDLYGNNGWIELLDNTGDDINDVIFIWEYEDIVVNSIYAEDCIYYNKYSYPVTQVTLDKAEIEILEIFDGENIATVSDISVGQSLAVFSSKSGEYVKVVISKNRMSGVVDEITQEDEATYLVIEGEQIKLSSTYYSIISSIQEPSAFVPKVGAEIKALLNIKGEVVDLTDMTAGFHYGYLNGIGWGQGLSNNIQFLIFDQNGTWLTMDAANKIKLNDPTKNTTSLIHAQDIKNDSRFVEANGKAKKQLIKYNVNEENQLNEIYTAIDYSVVSQNPQYYELTKDFHQSSELSIHYYMYSVNGFTETSASNSPTDFIASSDCVVFKVPITEGVATKLSISAEDTDFSLVDDKDAYFTMKCNNFLRESSYIVQAFDKNEFYYSKVLVYYYTLNDSAIDIYQNYKIFDHESIGLNNTGEEVKIWHYWTGGALKKSKLSKIFQNNLGNKTYKKGDCLHVGYNSANDIDSTILKQDASNLIPREVGTVSDAYHLIMGTVDRVENSSIVLNISTKSDINEFRMVPIRVNLVTNVDNDKITKGNVSNLKKGDFVAVRCLGAYEQEIVRYSN